MKIFNYTLIKTKELDILNRKVDLLEFKVKHRDETIAENYRQINCFKEQLEERKEQLDYKTETLLKLSHPGLRRKKNN